jgi:hypothetical protein
MNCLQEHVIEGNIQYREWENKEEDVSSSWTTFRKRGDTGS